MNYFKFLLVIIFLSFPNFVFAEKIMMECNIRLNDFVDNYSIEVDIDNGIVDSIYHAASKDDKSVAIDYKITSKANVTEQKIFFKAKLHSLDYSFAINKNTLEIIRYIEDPNDGEAGRGVCKMIESSGRRP